MKKNAVVLLIALGFNQLVHSQCAENASGFGNNTSVPMYNVQGAIQVVLNTNNTITLNLSSNFTTAAGPDVRIFLVDRGALTTEQLRVTSNFLTRPRIEMGLSPATGMTSFTKAIPAGTTITDFETVYFYCQAFSQFWDFGSFTPFTTANCAVLSTNDFEDTKLQLYPNPASNEVNIQLAETSGNYNVSIYNMLGVLVLENDNQSNTNSELNISQLNSGIYFVKIIDAENKTYQKRLMKK